MVGNGDAELFHFLEQAHRNAFPFVFSEVAARPNRRCKVRNRRERGGIGARGRIDGHLLLLLLRVIGTGTRSVKNA